MNFNTGFLQKKKYFAAQPKGEKQGKPAKCYRVVIVRYKGGTLGTNQQKKTKKKTQAFRSSLLLYFVLFTQYNCFCLSDNGVGMVAENAVILFKVQTLHGARTQS